MPSSDAARHLIALAVVALAVIAQSFVTRGAGAEFPLTSDPPGTVVEISEGLMPVPARLAH